MRVRALLAREPATPWTGDTKLPWDEPGFSARMLREHLTQDHDRASRRLETIERQVAWIDVAVLRRPSRVLDLGCGPGLYTERLARRGHTCVGVDFSPASIEHARSEAEREQLACEYRQDDLRTGLFDGPFDAALFLFGELNTFEEGDVAGLFRRVQDALAPGGAFVLEVHTEAEVRRVGVEPSTWWTAESSPFGETPHLCLRECTWHAQKRAATERFFVLDDATDEVETYVSTTQSYSTPTLTKLLRAAGFENVEHHPSLEGTDAGRREGLFVLVARRPE